MTTILEHGSTEEWLEQRRDYVTASEVSRLAHSSSAWQEIREAKRGGYTFAGNRYTRWGHEREAFLIEKIQKILPDEGIEPNDHLWVMDGTRWAATPDGVGAACVVDAKTGSLDAFSKALPQYRDQVLWQCMVARKKYGYIVFEERLQDDGDFAQFMPGGISVEYIEYDDHRVDELLQVANRFLDGADFDLDLIIESYFEARAERDKADLRMKELSEAIKEKSAGQRFAYSGDLGSVTVTPASTGTRFDAKAFQAEHPDLYERFVVPSNRAARVTFTEAKQV